jgi:hypothetical protein
VRPPPCSQHHAGHYYNHSGAVRHAGTGRHHACHCTPYGSPPTASPSPSEDTAVIHCAPTLEAATVRVQGTPWWLDRGKDHQGGRQLRGGAGHTSLCSWIVRHTCNSPSAWPIKGRWTPSPRGVGGGTRRWTPKTVSHTRSTILPQHLNLLRPLHQGLGGHAFCPALLVAAPLQAPRCEAI